MAIIPFNLSKAANRRKGLGWAEAGGDSATRLSQKKKHSIFIYIRLYNSGKVYCEREVVKLADFRRDRGMTAKIIIHTNKGELKWKDALSKLVDLIYFLAMHPFSVCPEQRGVIDYYPTQANYKSEQVPKTGARSCF